MDAPRADRRRVHSSPDRRQAHPGGQANDAYRYNKAALQLLGDSPEQAHRTALKAYCHDKVRWETRYHGLRPENLRDDAASYPSPHEAFFRLHGGVG